MISNADADYGTDTETIPDARIPDPTIPEAAVPNYSIPNIFYEDEDMVVELREKKPHDPNVEKTTTDVIRETADNTQSCRVCYDEYHGSRNQARVLACGHSFCTRCVISCSTNGVGTVGIKCPECRKISDQAPATVPINFQLMQMLTALSLLKVAQAPEQEQDLPNYENFERLGAFIPTNELTQLTLKELFEHMKAVFNAIRSRVKTDPRPKNKAACTRLDTEIGRLEDLEKSMNRSIINVTRLQRGDFPRDFLDSWPVVGGTPPAHDTDWMREMVVFRPPQIPPEVPTAGIQEPVAPVQDVDSLLREEVARAEADPNRNVQVVREAHLRRERENAQERQLALRNEQIMRDLLDDWDDDPIHDTLGDQLRRRRMERTMEMQVAIRGAFEEARNRDNVQRLLRGELPLEHEDIHVNDRDDESVGSNDSSFIDEPAEPPAPMTIGEAITIYRLVEVFSPRNHRQGIAPLALPRNYPNHDALVQAIFPPHSSVNDPLIRRHLNDLQDYARSNKVNVDQLLRCLRHHSIRFASNLVEAPRVIENRRRRQRPLAADDYNARLRIIRRRAKEALRGGSPTNPENEQEKSLTTRLIVNLANAMGVREQLVDVICPNHREIEEEKEIFVPKTNESTNQQVLFCTACRCDVPLLSKQIHSQGRRHKAALANRTPPRQRRNVPAQ